MRAEDQAAGGETATDEFFAPEDSETVGIIKDLIETRVRPAVANDGGDITFRGFKDGIVYLDMKGACSGCPSSTATLRHGIQNLLRHYVPDVVEVRPMGQPYDVRQPSLPRAPSLRSKPALPAGALAGTLVCTAAVAARQHVCIVAFSDGKPVSTFPENALNQSHHACPCH